jgi:hypothetical protein
MPILLCVCFFCLFIVFANNIQTHTSPSQTKTPHKKNAHDIIKITVLITIPGVWGGAPVQKTVGPITQ